MTLGPADRGFVDEVRRESGQDPSNCYQCGTCTAGCVYTPFFDYPVNQIMRLLQLGQKDCILASRAIWICATCEACTARCPCEIDVARIMDVLRIMARKEGLVSEKEVRLFHDTFLKSLRRHGRVYEPGILFGFNLRSGHLLRAADLGPTVLRKGKIPLLPKGIRGKTSIERIFRAYEDRIG